MMAPDNGALVQLQIECARILQKRGWSFISVVYPDLVDHLTVMKRKFFIFNKKDQVCVQTEALILHRMENFDQGTGKMSRFKLTRTF